jgi:hypothetical protein
VGKNPAGDEDSGREPQSLNPCSARKTGTAETSSLLGGNRNPPLFPQKLKNNFEGIGEDRRQWIQRKVKGMCPMIRINSYYAE